MHPAARTLTRPGRPPKVSEMSRRAVVFTLLAVAIAGLPRLAVAAGLAEAEAKLAKGEYSAAETALRAIRGAERARADVALARLLLETGRYPEARDTAVRAARTPAVRVAAETVRGEVLRATGDRDGAVGAWRAIADRPEARRARLLLGLAFDEAGDALRSHEQFDRFVQEYNDGSIAETDGESLSYVARAVQALGAFQDANEAFRDAARASPDRAEPHRQWAALFLEKYDAGHAEEALRDALRANPNDAEAHVLYARVKMAQSYDFTGARAELDKALATNPRCASARAFRAELAVMDGDFATAGREVRAALEVDAHHVPSLAVAAASAFIADDRAAWDRARQEVLRIAPKDTTVFHVTGRLADWEHRYDEVIALMEQALGVDADDLYAPGHVGINLLRMGDEDRGLVKLRAAFDRDPYNVQVYNMLNFYDDVLAKQYGWVRSKSLRVRMHNDERAVLERYVPRMLEKAWGQMVRRYGFTPAGPVSVEMFAADEHFAVRTTGLPHIGVQGVCFGKVVTAISPTGGPFNWGQILWHELAHVFSIQMSRGRVPRWFTEGLAEYEAMTARPEWARENDDDLYRALEDGKLPGIADLTQAFTHATSGDDVLVAYYASSMVVKHIVERHGFPKVLDMLRRYGRGERTETILPAVLGLTPAAFDREFREATRQRLAPRANDFRVVYGHYPDVDAARAAAKAAPRDAAVLARLAAAQVNAGQPREARATADAALAIDPRNRMALFLRADVAMHGNDAAVAKQAAEALLATGIDSYPMRLVLAEVAKGARDRVGMRRHLEAAVRLDPGQREAREKLAELATQENRDDDALAQIVEIARLDQHDREASRVVMDKLAAAGRWQDVRTFGEMAQFLDPLHAPMHVGLARAYERLGRRDEAIYELETAKLCRGADAAAIDEQLRRVRGGGGAAGGPAKRPARPGR